jgi:hypothetical protein
MLLPNENGLLGYGKADKQIILMHIRMVNTLGEMCICIPQLPSSPEIKKSEGRGRGREGDGVGVYSGATGHQIIGGACV